MDHTIDEHDEFVILATDGVWDVIDSTQAVQLVGSFAAKAQNGNWNALEAASWLTKCARGRWEKMSPMVISHLAVIDFVNKVIF